MLSLNSQWETPFTRFPPFSRFQLLSWEGNTWIRIFARRLSLERGSQRPLPRRTAHRYVYASSKLAQSGECAYEIYSRLYNVGNAPPATLRPSAPPSLCIPLRIPVFSQFRGKPRVSNIRSFIETHTSRILKSSL